MISFVHADSIQFMLCCGELMFSSTAFQVSLACREALDNSLVETLSNPSIAVSIS